ncbi:MAG: hypothetical protein HYU36_15330 [Planctomycetes bacterium]|nr:hypothetical protein [Planctomycetota bacterium]
MTFVLENLRLRDLVAIVRQNQEFYEEFVRFLSAHGYPDVHAFVRERNDAEAVAVLEVYLTSQSTAKLYDGLGRPYSGTVAKWYFLAWVLRDAPAQRLGPLLRSVEGNTLDKKKATLLNQLRKFVGPLFPEAEKWEWPVLSEVMLARLEGSRRALKGTHFESLVRTALRTIFTSHRIDLSVGDKETRINEETYDVQVSKGEKIVLLPVKTRETMGGGHANLFTRDIHKSISVARKNGYECIPVIIAESWGGDLKSLGCEHYVYIQANPNQTAEVETALKKALIRLIPFWKSLAEGQI